MIIFMRELKRNLKGFIIWTLSLLLAGVGMLAFFPSMRENAAQFNETLKSSPKAFVGGIVDISKVMDYYAYILPYIVLIAAIYAMMLGAGILSKEEDDGTAEFLLSKPVTRTGIIVSKFSAVAFYILIFNVINTFVNYVTIEAVKGPSTYNLEVYILLSLGLLIVMLSFASIGFLVSVFITRSKALTPITIGFVLGEFFISIASAASKDLENLKHITLFKYVEPMNIIKEVTLSPLYMTIMAVIIVVSFWGALFFYNKKDIST